MSTQTNAQAQQASNNFINLHVQGIGYLKRVREVKVRGSAPFIACAISAMFGERGVKDGIQYTPFDTKAVSPTAAKVLETFAGQANHKHKRVMVQFKIGDPYIDTFTYQQGDRAGQIGACMKGRLIKIYKVWIKDLTKANEADEKIGWELVYELPKNSPENANADQQQAA